jgi:SPP1 family predicted phage head-tail adaptor
MANLRTVEQSIGERAHKVTLENPGPSVPDGDGGYTESWVLIATVWGRVSPASAAELRRVVAGTVTALLPYLVAVRYVAGVTTQTRVTYHGRVFAVQAVRNVDERNVRLEIICEERVSGGAAGSSVQSAGAQAGAA